MEGDLHEAMPGGDRGTRHCTRGVICGPCVFAALVDEANGRQETQNTSYTLIFRRIYKRQATHIHMRRLSAFVRAESSAAVMGPGFEEMCSKRLRSTAIRAAIDVNGLEMRQGS